MYVVTFIERNCILPTFSNALKKKLVLNLINYIRNNIIYLFSKKFKTKLNSQNKIKKKKHFQNVGRLLFAC